MKKMLFAATAVAMLLYAPLAQAATVFDLTFTGTFALFGSPTLVNGTGTVTVNGLTGAGNELASTLSSNPKITDVDITLNLFHFDFGDTLFSAIATHNGNPTGFEYSGLDTISGVLYTLNTIPFTDDFIVTATTTGTRFPITNILKGEFTISPESIGTVPEPATWAMLVLGFGGIGAMLRLARRQRHTAAA